MLISRIYIRHVDRKHMIAADARFCREDSRFAVRGPPIRERTRARSIFRFGGECDDSTRGTKCPDSFFIVKSSPTLFYQAPRAHRRDMRDESAHSPRVATKVTWPLLDRVGARKRFQIY